MNLKSYARGIGAGLIVASLVLGIGTKTEKLSDSEIKKRASELGMIESQTLTQISSEISTETSAIETEPAMEDVSEGNESSVSSEISVSTDPAPIKEPDAETVDPIIPGNNDEKPSDGEENTEGDTFVEEEKTPPVIDPMPEEEPGFETGEGSVSIQVVRGDSSVSVARRMFEAGLVDSAVEFDRFLCENGYDKVISVGTYDIPYGLSFEEMAKIITRR